MAKKFISRASGAKSDAPKLDVYQTVTDTIIAALEAGTRPWVKGWAATGGLQLRTCHEAYKGINQILLGLSAAVKGYTNPYWLTFKQAQADGMMVRKGEKGTLVVFSKPMKFEDEKSPTGFKIIPMLKHYTVFNLDQMEATDADKGKPAKYSREAVKGRELSPDLLDREAEQTLRACGAELRFGGDRAFYSPMSDYVQLPTYESFKSPGAYLATMAHEFVHWTGHESREARKFGFTFGNPDYAREELVAELGAAMVCARLEVAGEHIDNHAAYLASWIKVLKSDKRAIVQASSAAQKAADRILGAAAVAEEEPEALAA